MAPQENASVVVILSSWISLVGCGCFLFFWKTFSTPNFVSKSIIVSLGTASFFASCGFVLSSFVDGYVNHDHEPNSPFNREDTLPHASRNQDGLCFLQASMIQFFYLAFYLWTCCFAVHIYLIIVRRYEYPERFLLLYRVISWGLPGCCVVVLLFRQLTGRVAFGNADRPWCWIKSLEVEPPIPSEPMEPERWKWLSEGALHQIMFFYGPISLVGCINAVLYALIVNYLKFESKEMAQKIQRKVFWYALVLWGSSLWGLLNRVIIQFESARNHQSSAWLTFMEALMDPLHPLLGMVVYGTNKSLVEFYQIRCEPVCIRVASCCCCLQDRKSSSLLTSSEEEYDEDQEEDDSDREAAKEKEEALLEHDHLDQMEDQEADVFLRQPLPRKMTYPLPL